MVEVSIVRVRVRDGSWHPLRVPLTFAELHRLHMDGVHEVVTDDDGRPHSVMALIRDIARAAASVPAPLAVAALTGSVS